MANSEVQIATQTQ